MDNNDIQILIKLNTEFAIWEAHLELQMGLCCVQKYARYWVRLNFICD
jgi:hypothetical protein